MMNLNPRINRLKIRTKILLVATLSTIIGVVTFSATFIFIDVSLLEANRNERLNSQMKVLASNLSPSLLFEDTNSADEILTSLALDETIINAQIIYRDLVFATYQKENTDLNPERSQNSNFWLGLPPSKNLSKEISVETGKSGTFTVKVSNSKLIDHAVQLIFSAIQVLIGVTFISFLYALWMQRSISRPILNLSQLSNRVTAEGNYSLRSDITGEDEIAKLAKDFNEMLDQIESRDAMLEKKVLQRTAEIEKLAEDFRHRAFHDTLTGLPNRALLNERFLLAVSLAKRSNTQFALLLLDLDNFKNINDSLGHDFGDELLKIVADRISSCVREEDLVCRLGGDEFIVLLENVGGKENVVRIATNISRALNKQSIIFNKRLEITTSIGGSIYPTHGRDLTTLKRSADIAMYNAKENGKNQYKLFEASMEELTLHRLMVQNELRTAISTGQIRPYYQPKIHAKTKHVIGCEVLVRWQHPKQGLIFPDSFIPFAEEAGLIRLIDYYVLDKACEQAKLWLDSGVGRVPVSINLSGAHFVDENIVGIIKIALATSQLPPELLEIELTEAVLISDPDKALITLSAISNLGVKISLDDFGVGYSSLYYLRKLPVDIIKIDKSFVNSVVTNVQDQRLIRGIISLAKGLELDVVAEGVETQQQQDFLEQAGCQYLQGYYYLKPAPLEEFEEWLATQPKCPNLPVKLTGVSK